MPPKKLSPGLLSEISKAAFKDGRKSYAPLFIQASREDIETALPDKEQRMAIIEELALQEDSPVFADLLQKFGDDEDSVAAILRGFNRDEKFCGQSSDGWGGPSDRNIDELKKKRTCLQKFVLSQIKKTDGPQP